MTQKNMFECDRCEKEFYLTVGQEPITLKHSEWKNDETIIHLCEDCDSTFWYFNKYVKRFDALATKIVDEEIKVEDEKEEKK